jgi:GTP-binding protein
LEIKEGKAFISTSIIPISSSYLNSKLNGKRGNKDVSKGNPKQKKEKTKNSTNKPNASVKQNKKIDTSSSSSTPSSSTQKSHLPPWQIMSGVDIQKNIQSEMQRRANINAGLIPSSYQNLDEMSKADVKASSSLISPTDRKLYKWRRFNPDKDIHSMSLYGTYLGASLPPSLGVPEVAFLGRSNVGKSSLLNKLTSPTASGDSKLFDLARVGKKPGATASVNVHTLLKHQLQKTNTNKKTLMAFVDLPGFGYAKLSKDVKESVEVAAERYLGKRRELALGILLVDIRRIPSDDDRAVLAALYDMGLPILVVATKMDKIKSKTALMDALDIVNEGLGLPEGQPLCISSATGEGVKQLWNIILDACEEKVEELKSKAETGNIKSNGGSFDDDSLGIETIQLDEQGNFMDEDDDVRYDQGYEWVQSYRSGNNKNDGQVKASSRRKMSLNEKRQAEQNEAMKLKNLKKVARELERKKMV